MAAISQQIPNLLGGASQQPDPVKLPGQVRDAVNVLLDPTFGCRKRPPIKWGGQLATNIPNIAKWFPMFRDENEKYITCMYSGANKSVYYNVKVVSNKYRIDGGSTDGPTLTLVEGDTIIFDQSDTSNNGKPLRISTTANGTHASGAEYTTNVITFGTPGTPGAYTKITKLATSAPTLYYYDSSTSGAGGQLTTNAVGTEPTTGWPTRVRVWDAKTGHEAKVSLTGTAATYLQLAKAEKTKIKDLKTLTVNDFTFIANPATAVTMNTNSDAAATPEAFVVINQVAYNTTYGVNFLRDGSALTQVKVKHAKKISITPATFEEDDGGGCSKANNQSFTLASGSKTGLGVNINTRCVNQQTQEDVARPTYPSALQRFDPRHGPITEVNYHMQVWATHHFSKRSDEFSANHHEYRTFQYTTANGMWIKVKIGVKTWIDSRFLDRKTGDNKMPDWEEKTDDEKKEFDEAGGLMRWAFVSAEIIDWEDADDTDDEWKKEVRVIDSFTIPNDITVAGGYVADAGKTAGMVLKISEVQRPAANTKYDYKSKYTTTATLTNGGVGWAKGDTVTQAMSGKTYTIKVEEIRETYTYESEASVSYTTPANTAAGVLDVGQIAASLSTAITALSNYTSTVIGNIIHIKWSGTAGRDFNIMTRGGTADNALYGIKGSVNDITMLPDQCTDGVILKVKNTAESDDDDYWVKFISSGGTTSGIPGHGSWEETVKPGDKTDINPTTMPHALIRLADGSFEFRALSSSNANDDANVFWKGRQVGDDETNPVPSFASGSTESPTTISGMFFFMNRLGFLSGDTVCLSQPADIFNFFNSSAIAISDADPIDMTASATKPAILKGALGTTKGLLLFAENSQFLLSTSEAAFGPSTVKMTEISSYAYTSKVEPVETGVSIMFPTEADTYSKVFEMAVDSVDNRPIVTENTRIVPEYIPPGLTYATASTNNSFVIFGDDSHILYTFKYYNVGNERQLAGWAKWTLPSPCKLIEFSHDTAYLILYSNGSYNLGMMEMLDDPETSPITVSDNKFLPRLDNYITGSGKPNEGNVAKSAGASKTKLYFPTGSYIHNQIINGVRFPNATPTVVYTSQGNSTVYERPTIASDATGYYVEVNNDNLSITDINGDTQYYPFILGIEYDFQVELPSFHVTQEKRADRRNPPMVENVYLDLYLSGRYSITLKRLGYTDRTFDLEIAEADIYLGDDPSIKEVITKVIPVYARGDHSHITITATDPLPASITGYSWEGHYNTRGIQLV